MGMIHYFKCDKCKTVGGHMDRGWKDIPSWNQFLVKHIVSCGEESISIFQYDGWHEAEDYEIEGLNSSSKIDKDILAYTTKRLTEKVRLLATNLQKEYEGNNYWNRTGVCPMTVKWEKEAAKERI